MESPCLCYFRAVPTFDHDDLRRPELFLHEGFLETPDNLMNEMGWMVISSELVFQYETIYMLEARA